jgi:hypothetical protein
MQIEGDWGFRLRNAPRRGLARIRRTSGFFMSAVVNFSLTLNEPAGVVSLAKPRVGGGKSLELIGSGPVGLVHRQKVRFFSEEKPHFGGRKLRDDPSAQGDKSGVDVRLRKSRNICSP